MIGYVFVPWNPKIWIYCINGKIIRNGGIWVINTWTADSSFQLWTPIGNPSTRYTGKFNGNVYDSYQELITQLSEEDIISWANYNNLDFIRCACKLTAKANVERENGVFKNRLIAELRHEGINDIDELLGDLRICFIKEHSFTPMELVEQLKPFERKLDWKRTALYLVLFAFSLRRFRRSVAS